MTMSKTLTRATGIDLNTSNVKFEPIKDDVFQKKLGRKIKITNVKISKTNDNHYRH